MRGLLLLLLLSPLLSGGQRYAERNVIPADAPPAPATEDYDYYAEDFADEGGADVYKWRAVEFPHPRNGSRFCNRLRPSSVCDPDMILTRDHADALDASIRELAEKTPCICEECGRGEGGIVVGIALFKYMFQPYNVHPVKAIKAFAETLRSRWQLGHCDNDLLIVVATTDRLSYTDVGEAAGRYLSMSEAQRIFVANRASFTAGHFFDGLSGILAGYGEATRLSMAEVGRPKEKVNVPLVAGSIAGSVLLLGVLLFAGVLLYRRCKRDKSEVDYARKTDIDGVPFSKSWSKKDIKVLFGSEKRRSPDPPPPRSQYEPCRIEESVQQRSPGGEEEEVIDFRLANPEDTTLLDRTQVTSVAGDLEKDLTEAAENIARTFPGPRPAARKGQVIITDI